MRSIFGQTNAFLQLFVFSVMVVGCSTAENRNYRPSVITIDIGDEQELENFRHEHRGKVVLVDFWATWCLPCLKQLNGTIELHNRYRDQGLAVVTVSFDDPDDKEQVLRVLKVKNASCRNILSKFGASAESAERFGLGAGVLPAYQIYDRTGKLQRMFASGDPENSFEERDVKRAVIELLDAPH